MNDQTKEIPVNECCDTTENTSCGCSDGGVVSEAAGIRETVEARYAAAARAVSDPASGGVGAACCSGETPVITPEQRAVFGEQLYGDDHSDLPDKAVLASLGCGNPTAIADLAEGETVLDLGSGGGIDVLLSARRVGPSGKAYGLDMTDEMLELARANQAEAGVTNAEFIKGTIEEIPLDDNSVDVIISNCVINLSGDKAKVLREAARVLRPGGRFAVTDVIADDDMDAETRADMQEWTGCIAGALTESEFRTRLAEAGFTHIEIEETHRVHEQAASAIVRASLPGQVAG
jgi:ubiquinone/menaquinone biosynthesis C-methylase UbiE